MKSYFQLSLTIVAISTLFSCGKNDTPAPVQKTYLTKLVRGAASTDFKYDSQNRFAGQVYRDATNHQEIFTTQFAPNNLPAEAILRDYTNSRASKYNYTYNAENKCTRIELRDSVNPTTYTLTTTYDFTYTATKISRQATLASTGTGPRIEYTIDANGNYTKIDVYNAAGTYIQEETYGSYDNKTNPYITVFEFLFLGINPKNNFAAQGLRNVSTGTTTNYTATHTYNSEGYLTQTVWNNGVTYAYTYEKR
jgi:hypothetical protein